jgi:exopolysaccharide biosynthesis WecB/TagA/CpsF family protein
MDIDNSVVKDPIIHSLTLLSSREKIQFLERVAKTPFPVSIGFINQYAYNLIHSSKQVSAYFQSLTYRLRDGSGIKIACEYNRCDAGENLNGTDFIPVLLDSIFRQERRHKLFVFGTEEPWLTNGANALFKEGTYSALDGFQDDNVYIKHVVEQLGEKIDQTTLAVIVLAMGMPKQERVNKQLMSVLNTPAIIICGGAIIDFYAGRFARAPYFFRRLGLEWLYRLCVEPKRLFRRYVLGIPMFILYMIKNKHFPLK